MSSGGLSNIYLDRLGRDYAAGTFCGVFSSDTIPPELAKRSTRFSFICNLSRERDEGTHFIAVTCTPRRLCYFDPLGLPCIDASINTFLAACRQGRQPRWRQICFSDRTIQHPLSYFCGFYTLLFVLRFEHRASWQALPFACDCSGESAALFVNDTLCIQFLKRELMTNK
jgi:hypothetical protein